MAAIFTTQVDEDSKFFQAVSQSVLLGLFSFIHPSLIFENKLLKKYSVMEQF